MSGYVYAFQSPSMHGVVKIGATKRDPKPPPSRGAEANGTWGPPRPYVMTGVALVDDAFATIHALLAKRRESPRREFFRLSDDETRALFAILASSDPPPAAADHVDLAPIREQARALDALRRCAASHRRAAESSGARFRGQAPQVGRGALRASSTTC